MAGREAVEKLVRDAYAAFLPRAERVGEVPRRGGGGMQRGDYDAMVALCAPSATLRLAGAPEHFAIAGTTRGRAGLRKQFEALAQFAFANQKMLSLSVDGDRAAVHWRATFKPTGKSAVTEFCDLWTIQNGKMTSLIQFIDTALVGHMVT
jgi:ketosteroid isomerase-like protein